MKCVDKKYTDKNQNVLGCVLVDAEEMENKYFLKKVKTITFLETLILPSAVSIQQFFRNANNPPGTSPNNSAGPPLQFAVTGGQRCGASGQV
ncbi:hypothetical protein [Clostridium sp. C105KSO13]|uniref:hypothetical protein n=1 Tax=Clostridium sp. C105KSO13 TaxID=1776045 RepID=UPI000740780A|nr:hypothetical protein [Clostridium sp. C105KSO13]CUX13409.1 hypothetical protein BN3456_00016 [Clostridium sp. C105KSO13]